MHSVKIKSDVEGRFVKYVLENSTSPNSGSASTYHRALEVLSIAFQRSNTPICKDPIIWHETNSDALMSIYSYVVHEQLKYARNRTGLFSSLDGSGIGKGYFLNRWCSAGVRKFAEFRAAERLQEKLEATFTSGNDGEAISVSSQRLKFDFAKCFVPDDINPSSKEGKERMAVAKTRINQSVFRRWVLGIYGGQCCVTGLNVPESLRASHIVAWSEDKKNRMNPSNGLCLSATYDAVFDRHLISFDLDYRMVVSKVIREFCTKDVCKRYFLDFEGSRIALPKNFLPDKQLLQCHLDKLVR